jgi:hypothetical protein
MLLEAFCVKNGVRGVEMIHISNQIILSLTQSLLQAPWEWASSGWRAYRRPSITLKAVAKKLVRGVINKINSGQRHGPWRRYAGDTERARKGIAQSHHGYHERFRLWRGSQKANWI